MKVTAACLWATRVLLNNNPTIFDCIGFNDALRWIDVINAVAFLTVDSEHRAAPQFAHSSR